MTLRPKQVVEAWVEALNRGDADTLASMYSEDAINHQVVQDPVEGRAAIRAMFEREFARAHMTCIVENLLEDGEWAILEWRDPLGLRGCGFFRVVAGQIRFQRGYWDRLTFIRRHGLPLSDARTPDPTLVHSASYRYCPRGSLPLRPDVPGAQYWAVALKHAMLTYFEVAPGARFETHRHESEQITWVLDGELCFEVAGEVVAVQEGEVIAIPSELPHAVFTRDRAARAIDAWSPVPEKYRTEP